MRLLVTGGAGFIGSNFVRHVLLDRYPTLAAAHVVVLDKLTYAGNLANLDPVSESSRLTFVEGEILDSRLVDEVMAGADAVVHFAAESHVDPSILARVMTGATRSTSERSTTSSATSHLSGSIRGCNPRSRGTATIGTGGNP
jgi:dTDP-D-glucose 4,6-dehydratase